MDQLEVATDGNIVDLLAKRSPLGGDLRMVIALSRSVTDFEVIGDEALRIANIAQQLYGGDSSDPNEHLLRDVSLMGAFAVTSLEKLLRSVDGLDDTLANELLDVRHRLEDEFEAGLRRLVTYVMQDSRNIGFAVSTVLTIKALERIGSHVQNVAESIIYQVQGTDIRHQGD
jgi:phosphate transport system protein